VFKTDHTAARLVPVAGAVAIALSCLVAGTADAAGPTPTPPLSQQMRQRAVEGVAVAAEATRPAAPAPAQPTPLPTPKKGVLKRAGEPDAAPALGATSAAQPSPTTLPTATPEPSATPIDLPELALTSDAVHGSVDGSRLLLEVPIRSQYDGTEYQNSNCGPTSLAMVLDAFGVTAQTYKLRNLTNLMQGNFEVEDGTSLWDLSSIAQEAGLRVLGLNGPGGYHRWTTAELRDEVRHGHPVVTLVKMRDLPDHAASQSASDHYVVVVGLDGENLLINDPAMPARLGYRRPISPADLEAAWADSSMPRHGAAFAATENVHELDLPDPVATPSPASTPGVDPNPPPPVLDTALTPTSDVPNAPTAEEAAVSPRAAADGASAASGLAAVTPGARDDWRLARAPTPTTPLDKLTQDRDAESITVKLTRHEPVAYPFELRSSTWGGERPKSWMAAEAGPLKQDARRQPAWLARPRPAARGGQRAD
jgi:uncharacterized protein YvpB